MAALKVATGGDGGATPVTTNSAYNHCHQRAAAVILKFCGALRIQGSVWKVGEFGRPVEVGMVGADGRNMVARRRAIWCNGKNEDISYGWGSQFSSTTG